MKRDFRSGLVIDFILTVLPVQIFMSVLSEFSLICLLVVFTLCSVLSNIYMNQRKILQAGKSTSLSTIHMGNQRPFITYYRAYVLLFTAFSILAVDFKIFPRYFAKAETYGKGLMDVGVGCFLVSNAIVSPEAKGRVSTDSPVQSVLKSLKSCIPLLILGFGRLIGTKSVDYQEHVTEYGTHWNFFFTLAAVKILCTVLFCCVSPRLWNVIGVLIIALYQHNLTYDGLRDYIIQGSDGRGGRHGFIDSNREGLISCVGFLCVYIMGVQLGKVVMKQRETVSDWLKGSIHIAIVTAGSWILLLCSEKYVEPVSRRFANLSYILWMMGLNSLLLLAMLLGDIALTCINYLTHKANHKETDDENTKTKVLQYQECKLMAAINFNGLFYFLSANILTGLVNMCVRTIYQPPSIAFLILTVYMFILSLVISFLYHRKISLKVW